MKPDNLENKAIDNESNMQDINDERLQETAETVNAETKAPSVRKVNFFITLFAAIFGMSTPQNKLYSKDSNEPFPDDIRANKKEGEEYSTIGDVLRRGGPTKVILIAALILSLALFTIYAVSTWTNLL